MDDQRDDELRALEREVGELRALLEETIRRARRAEQRAGDLEGSLRYRLGDALVGASRSFRKALGLPLGLAALVGGKVAPEPARLPAAEPRNSDRLRVLVVGHDLKFFGPLQADMEPSGRFEFRQDVWRSEREHDETASLAGLAWADVVVAEWCLGNAVWCARHKRAGQRLIVRFHLRERASAYPQRVDWRAVDQVVFVGRHVQQQACEYLGVPVAKAIWIPNLVDAARFEGPKAPGADRTLGLLGFAPKRKRLDRALDLFERLWRADPAWQLRIKGIRPEDLGWVWRREDERAWYLEQYDRIRASEWGGRVHFDPPGDDVPDWLRQVGYLVSASDFESFHVAIGEAMSSGALPVVWDWLGAAGIWPNEFMVHDVDEAASLVRRLSADPGLAALREGLKDWVSQRYGQQVVASAWADLLRSDA